MKKCPTSLGGPPFVFMDLGSKSSATVSHLISHPRAVFSSARRGVFRLPCKKPVHAARESAQRCGAPRRLFGRAEALPFHRSREPRGLASTSRLTVQFSKSVRLSSRERRHKLLCQRGEKAPRLTLIRIWFAVHRGKYVYAD